jgi:hypothetical protein
MRAWAVASKCTNGNKHHLPNHKIRSCMVTLPHECHLPHCKLLRAKHQSCLKMMLTWNTRYMSSWRCCPCWMTHCLPQCIYMLEPAFPNDTDTQDNAGKMDHTTPKPSPPIMLNCPALLPCPKMNAHICALMEQCALHLHYTLVMYGSKACTLMTTQEYAPTEETECPWSTYQQRAAVC